MTPKIISRKGARVMGLTRYYTGLPCKHGHISERWVNPGRCVECQQISDRSKNRSQNPYDKLIKRRARLQSTYNLTMVEFADLVKAQDGKCAVCCSYTTKLLVDHCHDKKAVRGLLCNSCNLMLGFAKDNINVLQSAIEYLLRH